MKKTWHKTYSELIPPSTERLILIIIIVLFGLIFYFYNLQDPHFREAATRFWDGL